MNIVILSHYYPPDVPGNIPEAVARAMLERGHRVRVLTTYPHYQNGRVSHGYRQKLRFVEELNGISVRRVPIVPSHSRNPIGRMANYLSFVGTARTAKCFVEGADVLYVHGTPATASEPARVWSKALGIPFVFHVMDLWPESATESGFLPSRILEIMKRGIDSWLSRVYASAAAVVAIAPSARELLIERGVAEDRAHLVYNWAEDSDSVYRTFHDGLSLLYAGNLGDFQDLDTVIKAVVPVAQLPGFRLRIAGSGVAEVRLKNLVLNLGLDHVIEFLGRIERDRMPELYAQSDFQIVSLQDKGFFGCTIPSKLQEGLAHGLPVITTVRGDVTKIVQENGLGFAAVPEDVNSLSTAYQDAYRTSFEGRQAFSERARSFFDANFSKQIAMDQLEAILLSVAN